MASLQLTNAEAAFAVPTGVIIGAAISFLATRRSARESAKAQRHVAELTVQAQRRLTHDHWLWQRRSELYQRALEILSVASIEPILRFGEPVGKADHKSVSEFVNHYLRYNTEMRLFAGESVLECWKKFGNTAFEAMRAWTRVTREGGAATVASEAPSAEDQLRQQMAFVAIAVAGLLDSIREELQSPG